MKSSFANLVLFVIALQATAAGINASAQSNTAAATAATQPSDTPRFDACVAKYDAEYDFVKTECYLPLYNDVKALEGWFSKGEKAEAAERNAEARIAEMKQIRDKRLVELKIEASNRATRQTPLQNAIDKLNEPCLYADENYVMRSCD